MLARGRNALWKALRPCAWPAAGALAGKDGSRSFGRHPKHDPRVVNAEKPVPSVKGLTEGLLKTPKRKEWLRQPFPYSKDDSKEERREKRDVYLFQRTIPAPVVSTVLHGCHTRVEGDATFRRWWYVDAEGQIAGKLAAKIVKVIMGKHKPIYDRAQNLGDFIVVVNADKIAFTGRKREQKVYRYHTGWPGGLVTTPVETMYEKKPEEILRRAVAGMLPKNTLRRERLKLLRIFAGPQVWASRRSAISTNRFPDSLFSPVGLCREAVMQTGVEDKHPHTAEDLADLPDDIVKISSPWATPKERVVEEAAGEWWLDEAGNPWPDLVDNHGITWSKEEAEALIQSGSMVYRDPELLGKDVPEPRLDTEPAKWSKNK